MSDRYDAGYINDFGGGDTEWWTDYLLAEVERANDFHADIHEQTAARIAALSAENERLRKALENMLKRYVDLAGSGDCGFWDPEDEDEVIASRAALEAAP